MAKPLVSDELWEVLQPLLPPAKPRRFRYPGRKPVGDRQALTGILFVLKTGIPWEDLPIEMGCGCGMTCWRRLQAWQEAGVWFQLVQVLLHSLGRRRRDRLVQGGRGQFLRPRLRRRRGERQKPYGSRPSRRQAARPGGRPRHPLGGGCDGGQRAGNQRTAPPGGQRRPAGRNDRGTTAPAGQVVRGSGVSTRSRTGNGLRERGIDPKLAKRYTEHGSGLGKYRWVVERFFSWAHGFRKLRFVTEKTQEMQFAFLNLALALICLRFL